MRVRCAGASVCLRVCGRVLVSTCLCVGVRGCVRVSPVHVGARVCASTCCVCVCVRACVHVAVVVRVRMHACVLCVYIRACVLVGVVVRVCARV